MRPEQAQIAVVIDDSASSVAQMSTLLRSINGCQPVGFTDPREGLAHCLSHDVDLVIVDYEMPDMTGLRFIESFRDDKQSLSIPVVMVTSSGDRDVRYSALQVGATDFLSKPIDPVEFVARMNNLLAASRAHKTLAGLSQWLTDEVRKISTVISQCPVSIMITDPAGRIDYVNTAFVGASGFTLEEAIGQMPCDLNIQTFCEDDRAAIDQAIEDGREWRGTAQGRRKNGRPFWESVLIFAIRGEDGAVVNLVSINEDITLRKEYEARLNWQTNYDSLTLLPNRMLALDRLGQSIALAESTGTEVAVIVIDIKRFKMVIESMGHAAGDEMLLEATRRLRGVARSEDTLARLGNDDFALILHDAQDSRLLQQTLETIRHSFAEPVFIEGSEVFISVAIGVALYPTDGDNASDVLRNAHAAMSSAKCEENSCWRFFTSELDSELRSHIQAESKLRHALDNGEFSLCYHPLIDIRTGEIAAAEALLRWHNADLGHVRPDFFIPIAEETGLIVPIGAWVVEQVCRDLAEWRDDGLPPLRIAVNVSSRQLTDCSLLDVIGEALDRNGFGPDCLELEVTERLLLDRSSKTLKLLGQYRDAGLRFSIDDFGTGYSSMSYLTAFPFDVLKIDRSFISKVTERSQDAALTQAIIAMAKSIQMEIVAEGVETEEQLDFLRKSGCTFAQGYLFAKPIPAAGFASLLRGWRNTVTSPLRHPTPN